MDIDGVQASNDFATIPDQSLEAIANRVAPRQVASGVTRGIQQLGSDRVYSDGGNQQIIVEDSASPRVLMGNQKTFGEGFYVSKAGINATTNSDPAQWIFNSNQNTFKIALTGTVSLTTTDSAKAQSFSIPHGLGLIPGAVVFAQLPPSSNFSPFTVYPVYGNGFSNLPYVISQIQTVDKGGGSNNADATVNLLYVNYEVDATNLTLRAQQTTTGLASSSNLVNFRYYILQETSN